MKIPPCGSCSGSKSNGSTARTQQQRVGGSTPRIPAIPPTRYIVNGVKFATLTAAQDYAHNHPGSIIRQR